MINKFPTTAIFLLIGLCLISSSTIVFAAKVLTKEGQVENEKNQPKEEKKDKKSGYDLTIIIKLNYPKLADTKPDLFKKVRLDINDINGSDSFQKYYNCQQNQVQ